MDLLVEFPVSEDCRPGTGRPSRVLMFVRKVGLLPQSVKTPECIHLDTLLIGLTDRGRLNHSDPEKCLIVF